MEIEYFADDKEAEKKLIEMNRNHLNLFERLHNIHFIALVPNFGGYNEDKKDRIKQILLNTAKQMEEEDLIIPQKYLISL